MMLPQREQGFTLVEVLVALVMAALLTTLLIDGSATARSRTARAAEMQKAVFLARTLLARAAVAPIGTSPAQGATNGFGWIVREQVILPDPRRLYGLVELEASVSSPKGVSLFAARTRRLKMLPRT